MENVYKKIDIVGSSTTSIEDAIQGAVARANDTLSNVDWFEVDEIRGHIENGKIAHYQVGIKIGFKLE